MFKMYVYYLYMYIYIYIIHYNIYVYIYIYIEISSPNIVVRETVHGTTAAVLVPAGY